MVSLLTMTTKPDQQARNMVKRVESEKKKDDDEKIVAQQMENVTKLGKYQS